MQTLSKSYFAALDCHQIPEQELRDTWTQEIFSNQSNQYYKNTLLKDKVFMSDILKLLKTTNNLKLSDRHVNKMLEPLMTSVGGSKLLQALLLERQFLLNLVEAMLTPGVPTLQMLLNNRKDKSQDQSINDQPSESSILLQYNYLFNRREQKQFNYKLKSQSDSDDSQADIQSNGSSGEIDRSQNAVPNGMAHVRFTRKKKQNDKQMTFIEPTTPPKIFNNQTAYNNSQLIKNLESPKAQAYNNFIGSKSSKEDRRSQLSAVNAQNNLPTSAHYTNNQTKAESNLRQPLIFNQDYMKPQLTPKIDRQLQLQQQEIVVPVVTDFLAEAQNNQVQSEEFNFNFQISQDFGQTQQDAVDDDLFQQLTNRTDQQDSKIIKKGDRPSSDHQRKTIIPKYPEPTKQSVDNTQKIVRTNMNYEDFKKIKKELKHKQRELDKQIQITLEKENQIQEFKDQELRRQQNFKLQQQAKAVESELGGLNFKASLLQAQNQIELEYKAKLTEQDVRNKNELKKKESELSYQKQIIREKEEEIQRLKELQALMADRERAFTQVEDLNLLSTEVQRFQEQNQRELEIAAKIKEQEIIKQNEMRKKLQSQIVKMMGKQEKNHKDTVADIKMHEQLKQIEIIQKAVSNEVLLKQEINKEQQVKENLRLELQRLKLGNRSENYEIKDNTAQTELLMQIELDRERDLRQTQHDEIQKRHLHPSSHEHEKKELTDKIAQMEEQLRAESVARERLRQQIAKLLDQQHRFKQENLERQRNLIETEQYKRSSTIVRQNQQLEIQNLQKQQLLLQQQEEIKKLKLMLETSTRHNRSYSIDQDENRKQILETKSVASKLPDESDFFQDFVTSKTKMNTQLTHKPNQSNVQEQRRPYSFSNNDKTQELKRKLSDDQRSRVSDSKDSHRSLKLDDRRNSQQSLSSKKNSDRVEYDQRISSQRLNSNKMSPNKELIRTESEASQLPEDDDFFDNVLTNRTATEKVQRFSQQSNTQRASLQQVIDQTRTSGVEQKQQSMSSKKQSVESKKQKSEKSEKISVERLSEVAHPKEVTWNKLEFQSSESDIVSEQSIENQDFVSAQSEPKEPLGQDSYDTAKQRAAIFNAGTDSDMQSQRFTNEQNLLNDDFDDLHQFDN